MVVFRINSPVRQRLEERNNTKVGGQPIPSENKIGRSSEKENHQTGKRKEKNQCDSPDTHSILKETNNKRETNVRFLATYKLRQVKRQKKKKLGREQKQ